MPFSSRAWKSADRFGLGAYRQTLAVRGFLPVMLLGMLVKMPVVAIPIVMTLHTTLGLGRGFAQAGFVTMAWTTGIALGTPFQGRIIDRSGLRPMLVVSTAAQVAYWGVAPFLPYPALLPASFLAGALMVSGSLIARLSIVGGVPEERRRTAFAVDSVFTELAFMAGPALAVFAVTRGSTRFAMMCLGGTLAAGYTMIMLRNPRVGGRASGLVTAEPARRWANGRLLAVLACTTAGGLISSGADLSVTATFRSMGQVQWVGVALLGCGVYSLVGGLAFGALSHSVPVPLLVGLLGLATMPLGLLGDWRLIVLALAPAAALRAPVFAATANAAGELAPQHARASAAAWYGLSLTISSALGAPLAGAVFDSGGPIAAFAAVGGAGALVALAAALLSPQPKAAYTVPSER